MSVPTPNGLPLIANKAPSPPLDPPQVNVRLYGFKVRPKTGLTDSPNIRLCGTYILDGEEMVSGWRLEVDRGVVLLEVDSECLPRNQIYPRWS